MMAKYHAPLPGYLKIVVWKGPRVVRPAPRALRHVQGYASIAVAACSSWARSRRCCCRACRPPGAGLCAGGLQAHTRAGFDRMRAMWNLAQEGRAPSSRFSETRGLTPCRSSSRRDSRRRV